MSDPNEWQRVESPPPECGWYLGMLLPVNFADLTGPEIMGWQDRFGCHLVWHNPDPGAWWVPDPHGSNTKEIGHRITHWRGVVPPPQVDDPPVPAAEERPWMARTEDTMRADMEAEIVRLKAEVLRWQTELFETCKMILQDPER